MDITLLKQISIPEHLKMWGAIYAYIAIYLISLFSIVVEEHAILMYVLIAMFLWLRIKVKCQLESNLKQHKKKPQLPKNLKSSHNPHKPKCSHNPKFTHNHYNPKFTHKRHNPKFTHKRHNPTLQVPFHSASKPWNNKKLNWRRRLLDRISKICLNIHEKPKYEGYQL